MPNKCDKVIKQALRNWKCKSPVHQAIKTAACMMTEGLNPMLDAPAPVTKKKTTIVIVDDSKKDKKEDKKKDKKEDKNES